MQKLNIIKPYFHFGSRTQSALRLIFVTLLFFTLSRLLFYTCFYAKAESFTHSEVTHAFLLGFRFDLRLAIILSLPMLTISFIKNSLWVTGSLARKIWLSSYTTLLSFITVVYAGDLGYYAYLESRISFRIFDFFKTPLISLQMAVESYNIGLWVAGLALLSFGIYLLLKFYIFSNPLPINLNISKSTKQISAIQSIAIVFFAILGVHSNLSQYPLRWSDSFFSQNIFIASLAMNPVHYLYDTAQNSNKDYDVNKVREHYIRTATYLGVKNLNSENLNFTRPVTLTPQFSANMNVVYIVMESMAAYKTGTFGNRADPSPEFDRLAQNGWLFRHYYVPTEGTARSLFCILTGIPDINSKSTSTRNPHIVNQHTLINGLKNHDKFYFIGGNAAWGNIRGVYMNNVQKLKMFEGENLDGPLTDVWGLSDLDLFRQTAKILLAHTKETANSKPFFALIQLASFHRPYTIPTEHGAFTEKSLSPEELKKHGFASNAEYNSFRFSDYSLGEFFRLIKNEKYFENTLFIIQGDHGLPHNGAEHLTDGYKFFGLNRFHTPLVFYSPKSIKPREFNMMVTEPDVMPTILGLTGHPFNTRALGRNIFADGGPESSTESGTEGSSDGGSPNRYAFSYVYYTSPLQIMLYDQNFLAIGTENKIEFLHKYMSDTPKLNVKDEYPDKFNEMRGLLQGIFESSKYLLHHNPKMP